MPRPVKPRPLEEYHLALSRLVRQTQGDPNVTPKFKRLVADALAELTRTMVK